MKVVVAVSGGVDSVVLLHQLVKSGEHELTVAHFDHGMRSDSAADARFVERLADYYGLEFRAQREELSGASEELARSRRYGFLFAVAKEKRARLATAHHMDDVVETVALNIRRGTRWRGLAAMSDERIWRPLTKRTKSELIEYALGERLEWVEDETNMENGYSRNRIRKQLTSLSSLEKRVIFELWQKQMGLRQEIEREMGRNDFPVSDRYFLTMIDPLVAIELLHWNILGRAGVSLLSSQVRRALMSIKTGRSGSSYEVGFGVTIGLGVKDWRIKES